MKGVVLAAVLLGGSIAIAQPAAAPIASVAGGRVRGVLLDSGAVFKGIAFAHPPVGDLRWREPTPARPWTGVRDASAFGAPCPQADNGSGFAGHASTNASEDCLFLNIWTPQWPVRNRLPVMVWIHGGGNFAGAAASDLFGDGSGNTYDGTSLARRGVVVVTTNYRLGTLGFFAHPELSAESPRRASGNYGLLDLIAALRWVRDNIERFGGDPRNVTVFGQSSGATNIGVLMTSPLAKGLFHRAIAESGTVKGNPRSLQQAEMDGVRLAASLKVPERDSIRLLRQLDVKSLLNAPAPLIAPGAGGGGSLRRLVIDGHAVPRSPVEVFAAGQEHSTPLIIGSNARERSPTLTSLPTNLIEALRTSHGTLTERAMALYDLRTNELGESHLLYGTVIEQWAGDTGFRCDSVLQALWHSGAGHATWQYEFSRAAPGREAVGAVHNSEIWYVFGALGLGTGPAGPKPRYDATDRAVSEAMQVYWTSFAKTGDPDNEILPHWPRFNSFSRPYLQFHDRVPTSGQNLRRPYCDLYIENVQGQIAR